jgi:hypothetical protein
MEDKSRSAGCAGVECCRVERAAFFNPVQLLEDRVSDGSRLDCHQRRDGIGKHAIDRSHGSLLGSVPIRPRIRHLNKDAGIWQ